MSERILTLFGEEIIPEQMKAVGRSRAKKKTDEKTTDQPAQETPAPTPVVADAEHVAPDADVAEVAAQVAVPDNATEQEESPAAIAAGVETTSAEPDAHAKRQRSTPAILPDDWQGTKQYYSIGEVADLFKVKTSHIRFWTNEFKLKVRTTRKGDRLYTPEQIKELRAINSLVKERGFTLKGAKTRLKDTDKMEIETVDLRQSLLHLRNKLVAIKNQLK